MSQPFEHLNRSWHGPVLRWPAASLRSYLVMVILVATVPLALFSLYLIQEQAIGDRDDLEQSLRVKAANLSVSIDREIRSSVDALALLSYDESLQAGDVQRFSVNLKRYLAMRPMWTDAYVATTSGQVLFSTRTPPSVPSLTPLARPQADRAAQVYTRFVDTAGGAATAVEVPVIVNGSVRFVLGAHISAARWQVLMSADDGMKAARLVVFDDMGRAVWQQGMDSHHAGERLSDPLRHLVGDTGLGLARIDMGHPASTQTREPARPPARPSAQAPTQAEASTQAGTTLKASTESSPLSGPCYVAWQRSADNGWGAMVTLPARVLDAARTRLLGASVTAGLVSLAGGLLLALFVARRVAEPLQQLARGGPQATPRWIEVKEIAALRDALRSAHRQRETARRNLQAKVDEFEALFGRSPVGLAIARDPASQVVMSNPSLDAMWGVDPSAPHATQQTRLFIGGVELAAHDYPLQRAAALGIETHGTELRIEHADGRHVDVLAYATPLHAEDGSSRGAICAFVDVTARREAQERLSAAERDLRSSQDLVELAQEAGHVGFFDYMVADERLTWTRGMVRLLGLPDDTPKEPCGGWDDYMPLDAESVHAAVADSVARRDSHTAYEFRVVDADDSVRWLSVRALISYDADGPLRVVGVAVDATAQKTVERERAEFMLREQTARRQAENANRAKDEFLAMLGHELRNPLSAMSAAVEVLNRTSQAFDAAGQAGARRVIARQVRHLTGLTHDLLDMARVSAGKIVLSQADMDLEPLVRRAVGALQMAGLFDRHRLTLSLESVWASTDELRFDQMVNNLLTNAVKYTPAGGTIEVSLVADEDEAVLRVRDTGIGMPAELLPQVFDLFVQGERSLDRRQGGLGIGLTLVHRLTDMHGGRVMAHSEGVGKGSVFTIRLPRVAAGTDMEMTRPMPLGEGSPRRVVIVEDNEDTRGAMETLLEMAGHQVASADNGEAGLAKVMAEQPDLALIDIGLPGRDGYSVARALRAGGYRGRLVALTGYGTPEDAQRALDAGFDEHQVKPLDWKVLERLLQ
ncbi:MAG: chemotaxis protein methyltransferase CheR [Rhizobacter sp.]|nr:chemotaxis protein methyltransferase CheR [Rhizobacter sp.]